MAFYADVMVNASKSEHRLAAHEEFYDRFSRLVREPAGRNHTFESLEWITQVTPADSAFRIISWQLMVSEDQYRYFGFLVPFDPGRNVVELHDKRSLRSEYGRHNAATWYGALYYGIQPFMLDDTTLAYMVLGFNGHDSKTNQKVADVLLWKEDDVQLGAPVFMPGDSTTGQDIRERIILEYADAASGRMQFDRERQMLVYDHVITIFTDGPDAGPLLVPDGSYHGYQYAKGSWEFVNKVFHVKVDTPPGPGLDRDKNLDIFGRPKN
ncbi:MAG: hypothetical protein R3330_13810 [Saprospiraceae bacterium]|nr:hypothetical protein [Saprospiraceae bacterium]